MTLTIVAIGLLGLLGMQTRSAGWQRDSFDRKAAAELAEQLAETALRILGWSTVQAREITLRSAALTP